MNIVFREDGAAGEQVPVGAKRAIALPAGRFEFIGAHEDSIGSYWMCSLFSPVFEFEDMDAATATASAAMEELFGDAIEAAEDERSMSAMWRGELPVDEPHGEPEPEVEEEAQADEQEPRPAARISRRSLFAGFRRADNRGEAAE